MSITSTTFSAFGGTAAPAVSAAGTGRIYFDSTSNTFKISQNGGPYEDILMDYSNAIVDKPAPDNVFYTGFKSAAPANARCVDIDYQIAAAVLTGMLYLQIHDTAAATPAAGAAALVSRAVSALDADTWQPVGTWKFVNGIFIGLSTTDRVWTASTDQFLFPIVRYLP
jgi:hypothetical protein